MTSYKHTQIGYLMLVVACIVFVLFTWAHIATQAEIPSADSGTNLLITVFMICILFVLASFGTLTVSLDDSYLRIKFGYGLFRKKIALDAVASVKPVQNHWYYGWGIRFWLWPKMRIYNVSGFDAVELVMKSGKVYRVGTDDQARLADVISRAIHV